MVESRKGLDVACHVMLVASVATLALPLYIAFMSSTMTTSDILSGRPPLLPGGHMFENYSEAWLRGVRNSSSPPIWLMLLNSTIMALGISVGKIVISILSAFAIVFFRFPGRHVCFWLIFITLMLPVEVRILPTYEVMAKLSLLDTRAGLILPIIASATATFLFRQFFLTVPGELVEAARIDGATPMGFFRDVLLPLSRTNIAALFVIMFIFGWNQYLWPLIVSADESQYTIVMGIQRMIVASEEEPLWNLVMATAVMALLPPVLVIVVMQKLFVRGLVETEK